MDVIEALTIEQKSDLCRYNARRIGKEHGIKFRRKPTSGIRAYLSDGSTVDFYGWIQAYNWIMEKVVDRNRTS